jgi:hypothetical protein
MIRITLIIVFVLSILSCSKSQLELTQKQEQDIASIAYGFETHSKNDEFAITTFIDSTIQKQSKEVLLQSIQENDADKSLPPIV